MNILLALANTTVPGLGFALRLHLLGTILSTVLYGSVMFALQRLLILWKIPEYLPFYFGFWAVFFFVSLYCVRRVMEKSGGRSRLVLSLSVCAIGLAANILIFSGAPSTFRYQGTNMHPAIEPGASLIVDRFAYTYSEIQRNDVVAFRLLIGDQLLISRVIGLPGERVEIAGRDILINGKALNSSGAFFDSTEDQAVPNENQNLEITLKDNEYYLMGDNRDQSIDSRRYGSIPKASIVGKVIFSR